ncbi:MAG: AIR synthase-related protein [Lachnospiraceae bacterium]
MKSGKVSDTVLRRSVLKEVQKVNEGSNLPLVGGGAGVFPLYHATGGLARAGEPEAGAGSGRTEPEDAVFGAMQTVCGEGLATAYLAAVRAANSLAAKAARPQYAAAAITVPETTEESDLRRMHERYCEYLLRNNIRITGGHTAVSATVTEPVVSVSMMGAAAVPTVQCLKKREAYTGLEVVMTKYSGLGGTALLAEHFKEELGTRYPQRFIERAAELLSCTEQREEAYIAAENGAVYLHAAAGGGVFGALWELAEYAECGLEIDLRAIPILQETVEVCEYFDVNPYQLRTEGVFLFLTEHGGKLCAELARKEIPAAVIGRTVPGLDRAVRNGEEVRYLEPNRVEEYERVMAQRRGTK